MDTFLTVKEAAELLRVNPMTIYRAVKEGKLPHVKVRNSIRISRDMLDAMVCCTEQANTSKQPTHAVVTRI